MQEVVRVTQVMGSRVSALMNQKLTETFTVEEINSALHQMAPLKALGPDGFTACFYQQNWEAVQLEICNAVLHF